MAAPRAFFSALSGLVQALSAALLAQPLFRLCLGLLGHATLSWPCHVQVLYPPPCPGTFSCGYACNSGAAIVSLYIRIPSLLHISGTIVVNQCYSQAAGTYRNTITEVTTDTGIQGVDAQKMLELFGVCSGIIDLFNVHPYQDIMRWHYRLTEPVLKLGIAD